MDQIRSLLNGGYQKTAPVHSVNSMSTKSAFYEFLTYFVFILVIFSLSYSFRVNKRFDVD